MHFFLRIHSFEVRSHLVNRAKNATYFAKSKRRYFWFAPPPGPKGWTCPGGCPGQFKPWIMYVSLFMYVCMYVCMDMKVYPGKVAMRQKNTRPANPWSRIFWRLMRKNLEILQKVVRFSFFPDQDWTNAYSIGGINLIYLKITLF